MKLITHPANKHLVEDKIKELKPEPRDAIHFIRSVEVQYNMYMEKDRPTGRWKVLQNKFYSYWNGEGEPPSWCKYFGFVEEEREPLFYMIGKHKTVFNPFTLPTKWGIENRRILTNYA